MTVRSRIYLLSVGLVALTALAAGAGIWAMSLIGSQLVAIAEEDIPMIGILSEIETRQLEQEVLLEKALRAGGVASHAKVDDFAAGLREHRDAIARQIAAGERLAEAMGAHAQDEVSRGEAAKIREALERIDKEERDYNAHIAQLLELIARGDTGAADALAQKVETEAGELGRELKALLLEIQRFTDAAAKEAEHTEAAALKALLALFVAGVCFGAGFAYLIGRSIVGPLARMQDAIARSARDKDLTISAPVERQDEIGATAAAFNHLMGEFRGLIARVGQSAETVAASSEELAAASEEVATSSQSQADSASAMGASVEQMTVSVNQIADHAKVVGEHSDRALEVSEKGGALIGGLLADIERIAKTVHSTADTVSMLGGRSREIQQVVGVISEIAEQTNLLALNAAIEAARAGEQGRGFAVVADEVRKLAERSGRSAREIAEMIGSVRTAIGQAVEQMADEVREVNAGAAIAREVGDVIERMRSGTARMVAAMHEVSGAISEQGAASNDLASHVEHIVQMTDETNAAVQQTASAAAVLGELACQMQELTGRFKT